jgi:hypothetical protein
MNFEDLFKKPADKAEYVTAPTEQPATLESFFKAKTPAPAKPQYTQTAPIGEEKKNEIKKAFAPAPAPVEQAPAAQAQQAVPQVAPQAAPVAQPDAQFQPEAQAPVEQIAESYVPKIQKTPEELASIPDQAESMLPNRTWTDFLPYLAPFAVSLLSGGQGFGEASGIAGTQLLKGEGDRMTRKHTLEDKLLEMQKLRLKAAGKGGANLQAKSLRNKNTGEYVIGSFDPKANVMYGPDKQELDTATYELAPGMSTAEFTNRQGITEAKTRRTGDYFGKGTFTDPERGLKSQIRNGQVIPVQQSSAPLDPNQIKDVEGTYKPFLATDAYKKPAAVIQAATGVENLLKLANNFQNPTAAEFARKELAKLAEGGGKLTDKDVEDVGGSKAARDQALRYTNLQTSGMPLTETDMANLREVSNLLKAVSQMKLRSSIDSLDAEGVAKGAPVGAVRSAMGAYVPGLYESQAKSAPAGKVKVISPDGVVGYIPQANLEKALKAKYKKAP